MQRTEPPAELRKTFNASKSASCGKRVPSNENTFFKKLRLHYIKCSRDSVLKF